MEYYGLIDDFDIPNRWQLSRLFDSNKTRLDQREFRYGLPLGFGDQLRLHLWNNKEIISPKFPLILEVSKDGLPLDITFAHTDIPIASSLATNILTEIAHKSIQIYPVCIANQSVQFYMVNIITQVDCIDKERSDIVLFEVGNDIRPDLAGTPEMITNLHIDKNLVRGQHIFRLLGWTMRIVVSEVVKSALENAHVTGIKFDKLS